MRAGHGKKSPVLRTAAVLLLVLSIATTSASAAAVIDPSANTRRIQPPDSNNTPRSPTPPPPSSLSNSTHTFSSDPASYPDQADTASTASTEATSRRRPRPWQWGPPRPKRDGTLLHDVASGLDRDRDASADPSSDEQAASTASADDIEARRRPDGWRNDRRDELSHTEVKRDSDSDSDDHGDDHGDDHDDDDDDDDDGRSHVGIGTWAGIIVGAAVGAVLVAAGGYALVVGRRRRRGSIAEQKALYAQARKEDERRVWEGDDDEGDWGMGSRHGNGGGGGGGVGDLEKGGLVVTVEDYRGVR